MRRLTRPLLLSLVSISLACGGDAPPAPTTVATPEPTPSPTPTPIPTPPLGTGLACGLPARAECGGPEGPAGVYGCCRNAAGNPAAGDFRSRVNQAIDALMGEQPGIFRGEEVLDRVAYVNGVARILERNFRVCAKAGVPGDEVGVKDAQNYNEQYDILLSNGRVRRDGLVATCQPARF